MSFPEPRETVTHAEVHAAAPASGAPVHGIFLGPLGLRAGWGIALYLLLVIALSALFFTTVFAATGQMHQLKQERQQQKMDRQTALAHHQAVPILPLEVTSAGLTEFAEASACVAAAVALSFLEKRRFGVYGLPARHLRDTLPGALCGIFAISLLIGSLRALRVLVFDARLLAGAAILRYGAGWLLVFACVGLFEEFLFRGYLQFTLMRGILALGRRLAPAHAQKAAFWLAALIWSLAFSATHLGNAGEDPVGIVAVFAAGTVFAYALWRTGSLWWGVGFHMAWDWGQSFLYGVPDSGHVSAGRLFATHTAGPLLLSGGTAGPEGSVLVLPVLALVALVLRLHPQAAQPPVEPTSLPRPREAVTTLAIP